MTTLDLLDFEIGKSGILFNLDSNKIRMSICQGKVSKKWRLLIKYSESKGIIYKVF